MKGKLRYFFFVCKPGKQCHFHVMIKILKDSQLKERTDLSCSVTNIIILLTFSKPYLIAIKVTKIEVALLVGYIRGRSFFPTTCVEHKEISISNSKKPR